MHQLPALDSYIVERQITGDLLELLGALDHSSSKIVEQLISALSPSANALRDLLELAGDIAARQKCELQTVLAEEPILSILSGADDQQKSSNKKQLLAEIKSYLFSRRYPEVAKIQNRLAELQKSLAAKYKIKVELPAELEGDKISVKISAKNEEELSRYGDSLSQLAKSSELAELFAILKGQQ